MTNKTKFQKIKSFLSTYVPGLSSAKAVKEFGGWMKDDTDLDISNTRLALMKKKLAKKKKEKGISDAIKRYNEEKGYGFKKSTETKTRPKTTIGDFRTLNVVSRNK